MTKDIKWIILIVIVLLLSNLSTGITIDRLGRKEIKARQKKYDSLEAQYKLKEKLLKEEVVIRRKIFLADSLLVVELDKLKAEEQKLRKDIKTLKLPRTLTTTQELTKLDSAYEKENK